MNKIIKKAADLYRKMNYCVASAEVYLHEAEHAKH